MAASNSLGKMFIELGLKSSLKGDLSQANAQVSRFDGSVGKLNTTLNSSSQTLLNYGNIVKGMLITAGGAAATYALNSALRYEQLERGFTNLVKSQGKDVDTYINNLKEATRGTVSQSKLLEQANRAMLLGLDIDTLTEMAEGATVIAQATGQDPGYLFESLALGVGRQSRMLLDNLGIIVKVDEANQRYAENLGKTVNELTDAEKKIAFLDAAMAGLNTRVETLGGFSDDTKSEIDKLKSSIADLTVTAGEELLPIVDDTISTLNKWGEAGGFENIALGLEITGGQIENIRNLSTLFDDIHSTVFDISTISIDFLTGKDYKDNLQSVDNLKGSYRELEKSMREVGYAERELFTDYERPEMKVNPFDDLSMFRGVVDFDTESLERIKSATGVDLSALNGMVYEMGTLCDSIDKNTAAIEENTEEWKNAGKRINDNSKLSSVSGATHVNSGEIYNIQTGQTGTWTKDADGISRASYDGNTSGAN